MANYDYVGAKKAGLTDADIAEYLSSTSQYDLKGALDAGLEHKDVIQ